jgi:tRNA G37 N-methylase TrmD
MNPLTQDYWSALPLDNLNNMIEMINLEFQPSGMFTGIVGAFFNRQFTRNQLLQIREYARAELRTRDVTNITLGAGLNKNSWLSALKQWNKGRSKWIIPKKGTKEYAQVKKLMK